MSYFHKYLFLFIFHWILWMNLMEAWQGLILKWDCFCLESFKWITNWILLLFIFMVFRLGYSSTWIIGLAWSLSKYVSMRKILNCPGSYKNVKETRKSFFQSTLHKFVLLFNWVRSELFWWCPYILCISIIISTITCNVGKLHHEEHYNMFNADKYWRRQAYRTPINHQADDENYFVHAVSFH